MSVNKNSQYVRNSRINFPWYKASLCFPFNASNLSIRVFYVRVYVSSRPTKSRNPWWISFDRGKIHVSIRIFHSWFCPSTRVRHRAVRFWNKRSNEERTRNIEFYRNEPRLIRTMNSCVVLIKAEYYIIQKFND